MNYEFKILKLGILTFLFISMANRFNSMVFVLNFSTSGLNSSILFSLLFVLAPIIYPIIKSNLIKKSSFSFIVSILAFITLGIVAILLAIIFESLSLITFSYNFSIIVAILALITPQGVLIIVLPFIVAWVLIWLMYLFG